MAVISGGTLTTDNPNYYNAALDTTGGYVEVTRGQLRYLYVYASAACYAKYGTGAASGGANEIYIPAGGLSRPIARDPSKGTGETWNLFVRAVTGTAIFNLRGSNESYIPEF